MSLHWNFNLISFFFIEIFKTLLGIEIPNSGNHSFDNNSAFKFPRSDVRINLLDLTSSWFFKIKTFSDGFLYYAIIYLSIFWFIVFFVNIDNNIQVDYMNFDNFMNSIRSILYYYYMGTNGISRLLVHCSLILVLLIIPIILNIRKKKPYEYDDDYNTENELIDFEERNKLNRSLSTFTIYIWILTSIIATKF